MKITRTQLRKYQEAIKQTKAGKHPPRVYAQIRDGGDWSAVTAIRQVSGHVWVSLATGGTFMAWALRAD